MRVKGQLSGFRWDSRRKEASFEVIVPGTGSKVRRRMTAEYEDRQAALTGWKKFRDEVIGRRGAIRTTWTLRTYVEAYGDAMRSRLAARSALTFDDDVRRVMPYVGDLPLGKINAAVVRDLVGQLGSLSPDTTNRALATVRKTLRDAVDRDELEKYPIRGKLPMRAVERLRLEMTPKEVKAFLAAFDDEAAFRRRVGETRADGVVVAFNAGRHAAHVAGSGRRGDSDATGEAFARFRWSKPLFVVALETGLAKQDLLGLRWSEVDLPGGMIRKARGKTKVEAEIPMSEACRLALEECKARPVRGELVFLARPEKVEPGVFELKVRPMALSTVLRHFVVAKELAKITRRLRLHDLRHTFGSRLASAGVGLQVIARALGHTSSRMAERYARPSAEAMRAVSAALDAGAGAGVSNSAANSAAPSDASPESEGAGKSGS